MIKPKGKSQQIPSNKNHINHRGNKNTRVCVRPPAFKHVGDGDGGGGGAGERLRETLQLGEAVWAQLSFSLLKTGAQRDMFPWGESDPLWRRQGRRRLHNLREECVHGWRSAAGRLLSKRG